MGLPELTEENFKALEPSDYAWIHFEGRPSLTEVKKMLKMVKNTKTSLEIEKIGRNYEPLLADVDVIFVSKEFAESLGCSSMTELVSTFHTGPDRL